MRLSVITTVEENQPGEIRVTLSCGHVKIPTSDLQLYKVGYPYRCGECVPTGRG